MKDKTPLVDTIKGHIDKNPISFHMPGHKGNGEFMGTGAIGWDNLLKYDLTEIPGLDDLHRAEEAIEKAQRLTADAYGADRTYFMVNGSTAGIISALLAAGQPGDAVIVDRGCHLSVHSGLMLGRLEPVYIRRPVDEATGVPLSMQLEEVKRAFELKPIIKALIITNPTYYGVCSDIRAIADLVYENGALLIVDEAHGAHLKFLKDLPASTVDLGADIVIQSAHKTLPAMTQSSWLHVKGDRVDRERLGKMLSIFQSTSPSYPLMASLDNARYMMETVGAERLKKVLAYAKEARAEIDSLNNGLFCPDKEYFKARGAYDFDNTKMLINCAGAGLTGYRFDLMLRQGYGVYGELYDSVNWLGMVTVASEGEHFTRLVEGCGGIKGTAPAASASSAISGDKVMLPALQQGPLPVPGLAPWEVLNRRSIFINIAEAEGRIAGSGVVPYPPGIPLICPGERFTKRIIEDIQEYEKANITIKGMKDGQVEVVD